MSQVCERWTSRLIFGAAALFLMGALTGAIIPTAEGDEAKFGRLIASHLNALLGAFWMLGLAWSLPRLKLGDGQLGLMCGACILSGWANWSVTLVKAFVGVAGIEWGDGGANGVVWIVLVSSVVLPTFVGAGLWVFGAWRGMRQAR